MRNVAWLISSFLLLVPSVALAGGCPTCTTSAECGTGGFCVEWSRDFGCGTQRVACCPGQGCDAFSGRPSCEGVDLDGDGVDDCRVVDEDAGTPAVDAGPADTDAGSSPTDGGGADSGPPSGADAGGMGADAGGMATDAGPGSVDDGGCSCRAGARSAGSGSGPVALVLALLSLVVARKRR